MSNHLAKLFLVMAILVVSGCGTMQERNQEIKLEKALRSYERAIRWGDYSAADSFRAPSLREQEPTDSTRYKDFRVSSYKVLRGVPNADATELTQSVQIQYYHDHSPRIRTVVDEQNWRYDSDTKTWYLHGPLPDFSR